MDDDRRMKEARTQQVRRAELHALLDTANDHQSKVVAHLPGGAVLVWNPVGRGRLTFVEPIPQPHPPVIRTPRRPLSTIDWPYWLRRPRLPPGRVAGETGLHFTDQYLALDNVPLLRWRTSGCPSCEQLAQAAVRRPEALQQTLDGMRAITTDEASADLAGCVGRLSWLFALLSPGFYAVTLKEHLPVTDDACVWGACDTLGERDAMRNIFAPGASRRLIPTQTSSAFRPEAWARAQASYRTHPSLALRGPGVASFLLDGHHRALAAAQAGATLPCLMVEPVSTFRERRVKRFRLPIRPPEFVGPVRIGTSLEQSVVFDTLDLAIDPALHPQGYHLRTWRYIIGKTAAVTLESTFASPLPEVANPPAVPDVGSRYPSLRSEFHPLYRRRRRRRRSSVATRSGRGRWPIDLIDGTEGAASAPPSRWRSFELDVESVTTRLRDTAAPASVQQVELGRVLRRHLRGITDHADRHEFAQRALATRISLSRGAPWPTLRGLVRRLIQQGGLTPQVLLFLCAAVTPRTGEDPDVVRLLLWLTDRYEQETAKSKDRRLSKLDAARHLLRLREVLRAG